MNSSACAHCQPVRRLVYVCACVFFCFALGCRVMGPAGRAEAIHFPSATLKAASREGGREGGWGKNKTEVVVGGVYILLQSDRQRATAFR